MSKVTTINKNTMQKVIRPALDAKLAELSKELGIQVTSGNGRFGDTTGSFKIELAVVSEDGHVMTPEREAFLQLHSAYGLPKEALDAEITMGGHQVRIAGIRTRAPKKPILLDCLDNSGRQMVSSEQSVLMAYERQYAKKKAS